MGIAAVHELTPRNTLRRMDPWSSIDDILEIVRTARDAREGYAQLLQLCGRRTRLRSWPALPAIDADRDVSAATVWLHAQLVRRTSTTGVYLGLDTLNMRNGRGTNVELGGSTEADLKASHAHRWLQFGELWYGSKHLIRSLVRLRKRYFALDDDLRLFADYVFFLGYSGLVLTAAIARLPPTVRAGRFGRLYVWGFHDGDLYPLVRAKGDRFARVAKGPSVEITAGMRKSLNGILAAVRRMK
jgi:hypothetical protein